MYADSEISEISSQHATTSSLSSATVHNTRIFPPTCPQYLFTAPWPHEESVVRAGYVVLSAPMYEQHLYPINPRKIHPTCTASHISNILAVALEHVDLRRQIARHAYLVDGNDLLLRNGKGTCFRSTHATLRNIYCEVPSFVRGCT